MRSHREEPQRHAKSDDKNQPVDQYATGAGNAFLPLGPLDESCQISHVNPQKANVGEAERFRHAAMLEHRLNQDERTQYHENRTDPNQA